MTGEKSDGDLGLLGRIKELPGICIARYLRGGNVKIKIPDNPAGIRTRNLSDSCQVIYHCKRVFVSAM